MPEEIGGRNWGNSFTAQRKFRIASSHQNPVERPGTDSPTEPVAGTNPADILILDIGHLELLVIHENFEFYWAQEKLLETGISVAFCSGSLLFEAGCTWEHFSSFVFVRDDSYLGP